MVKNVDINIQREVAKNSILQHHLVEIALDTITYRITDAAWNVTHEDNVFDRIGGFLGFSDVTTNANVQIEKIKIGITGTRQEDLNNIAVENVKNRPVKIWRQLWNPVDGVVGTYLLFEGAIASTLIETTTDGEAKIVVTCSDAFVNFNRVNGRRTNDADHQYRARGDTFFTTAKDVIRKIKWEDGPYDSGVPFNSRRFDPRQGHYVGSEDDIRGSRHIKYHYALWLRDRRERERIGLPELPEDVFYAYPGWDT